MQGIHHLAVYVQLELADSSIAHAHGPCALISWEPPEFDLGESALARHAIHDLQLGGVAGCGAKEPVSPCSGLVGMPGGHESIKSERGIPKPPVSIVPVADSAKLLG